MTKIKIMSMAASDENVGGRTLGGFEHHGKCEKHLYIFGEVALLYQCLQLSCKKKKFQRSGARWFRVRLTDTDRSDCDLICADR